MVTSTGSIIKIFVSMVKLWLDKLFKYSFGFCEHGTSQDKLKRQDVLILDRKISEHSKLSLSEYVEATFFKNDDC